MATNTGTGSRKGAVKGRTQVYNPTTGNYIKRDATTGKFMASKPGEPFKGVRKEKTVVFSNPSVDKKFALHAEAAVIKVKNQIIDQKNKAK